MKSNKEHYMTKVNFYDSINDSMLKFAIIIARHNGKWVFCKHKERNTWEAPGGHREDGEDILETAKRELYEETGAITFDITPICIYSVTAPDNFDGMETFGKLFFSDIHTFEKELHSEKEVEDVIAAVAVDAVREVEGVAGMMTSMGGVMDLVDKKNAQKGAKGVKIDMTGAALVLDIYLTVEYGHPIPTVAENAQKAVIGAVEAMTGCSVEAVNIHVGGVTLA